MAVEQWRERGLRDVVAARLRRAALDADAAGVAVRVLERGEVVRLWRAAHRLGPGVLPAGRLVLLCGMTAGTGAYLYLTPALLVAVANGPTASGKSRRHDRKEGFQKRRS